METGTTTTSVADVMSGIGPQIINGFGDVITACVNLAVGLVPLMLGYLGVLAVIKQGKKMFKTVG